MTVKLVISKLGERIWLKPDRMIIRFLEQVLERKVQVIEAQEILQQASAILKEEYSNINPRLLDYLIWNYTRNKAN